jgi:membrane dipeptidase
MDRPLILCDGHVDLVYALQQAGHPGGFDGWTQGAVTPASLHCGGVGLLVNALYCADVHNGPATAWPHLESLMEFAATRLSGLRRGRRGAGLANLPVEETTTVFLVENGDGLLEADLDALQEWGIRVVGLTHAGCNRLADGNGVADPDGLTAAGRALLAELGPRGWAVDLAHLAEPGFWQVLESFPGPLITSHTGLRPFCDRSRNLSPEQLAALAARGGLIGLSLAPEMLTGTAQASLDDVVRQLEWLAQRCGPQVLAIGSDYGGFDGVCTGLEDYCGWRQLAAELERLGWQQEAIAGVLGENWLRFYRELLP